MGSLLSHGQSAKVRHTELKEEYPVYGLTIRSFNIDIYHTKLDNNYISTLSKGYVSPFKTIVKHLEVNENISLNLLNNDQLLIFLQLMQHIAQV